MAENAFAGHAERPTKRELALALGEAIGLWKDLVAELRRDLKLDAEEWCSYSVKAGWSFRLKLKKRNIVYLGPRPGYFLASLILGEKAVAEARECKLPTRVLKMIDEAKRYPEGTAIQIEVRALKDISVVKTLAKIKIEK